MKHKKFCFVLCFVLSIMIAFVMETPKYAVRPFFKSIPRTMAVEYESHSDNYIFMHPDYETFPQVYSLTIPVTLLDRLIGSDISVTILNKKELAEYADGYFVSFIADGTELKRLYIPPEVEKRYTETIPIKGRSSLSLYIDKNVNPYCDRVYVKVNKNYPAAVGGYALFLSLLFYYAARFVLSKRPRLTKYTDAVLGAVSCVTLTAAVVMPSVMRGIHLKRHLYDQTYHVFEILSEDSEIILFLLLAYVVLSMIKNRGFRRVAAVVPVILYIYFVGDVVTVYTLNSRLLFSDVLKYAFGMETHVANIAMNFLSTREGIVLVVASLFAVSQYFTVEYCRNKATKCLIILLVPALAFAFRFSHPEHTLRVLTQNVLRNNISITRTRNYTDEFVRAHKTAMEEAVQPVVLSGQSRHLNVILVIYESLSHYQSMFFSGLNNYVPRFDELSQENMAFKEFFHNTYNSSSGNFNILTGHFALPTPKNEYPWENDKLAEDSVIHLLNRLGYETIYITPQPFNTASLGEMAKLCGFKSLLFGDSEVFKPFTVPYDDDELYEALLNYVKEKRCSRYFACAVTTTSHPPYIDPVSKAPDLRLAFKYSDQALHDFCQKLQQEHFFDDGILIVVGDHRAWEPISHAETALYGAFAAARTPLTVIGKDMKKVITANYQTSDINPSLSWLLTDSAKFYKWQRNMFDDSSAALSPETRFILHHSGNDRDHVFIKHGGRDYLVRLNGDETNFEGDYHNDYILNVIHAYRSILDK